MCAQLSRHVVNSHVRNRRPNLSGTRVLVVSSDATQARQMAMMLTRRGGVVCVTTSAEEALIVVPTFRPQVLVTDLVLPHMSGFVLVHNLKGIAEMADMVVVAVTRFDSPLVVEMAAEVGCAACLRTPINAGTFADTVAALVQDTAVAA